MNMQFERHYQASCRGEAGRAGFTLAEVLAALVLLAIVIPVAVEGLRVANQAAQLSQRKVVAARIGEGVLNEWLANTQQVSIAQRGTVEEAGIQYAYNVRSESWTEDSLLQTLTVYVEFPVQGRDCEVRMSTLVGRGSR
jgi:prepilin-type N-terminal cleavage/methylation domain-containing protein